MDYWKMEQKAEEQRAQIRQDLADLRLQQEALRASQPQDGWFAHNMIIFGTWMVSTGERLRSRYQCAPVHRPGMRGNSIS